MPIEKQLDGRVLRLALNRPEKRNAIDLRSCQELTCSLRDAIDDRRVGAILLSGNGKAFCAGMDLTEAAQVDKHALAEAHEHVFTIRDWMVKPVIAAVHGPALAGGTGLAANAHIVIASEDAIFGLTEVRLGLWPVLIFPAVVAAVGERRAIELALSGRTFTAVEAERYGLVTEVVPDDQLTSRASEVAASIAEGSATAIRSGLEYVRQIRGKSASEAQRAGRFVRDEMMRHPDFAEGLRAFREKRKPVWSSHIPT